MQVTIGQFIRFSLVIVKYFKVKAAHISITDENRNF